MNKFFSEDKTIRRIDMVRLIFTLLFVISVLVCVLVSAGELDIYLPEGDRVKDYTPEHGIIRIIPDPNNERHMTVDAVGRGREYINNEGERGGFQSLRILPGGIIYDDLTGNFSGWKHVVAIVEIFVFLNTGFVVLSFVMRCRKELFSYTTLFSGGAALLWISIVIDLTIHMVTVRSADAMFSMMYIYSLIKDAGGAFLFLSCPIMAIVVLSLIVSNASLIRHEGRSFVNVLGLFLSLAVILGYVLYFFMGEAFSMGSEQEMRVYNTISSLYDTVFVYFQAMLLSASVCGMIAATKNPARNKTHIIILGCALAADGTPLPLLRGRIERAISFAKAQAAAGGGEIVFVPSGGQGSDEVISEAESMRNYLISKGISEDKIIVENKSATTQENMRFSYKKITADCESPKIVFATSGYHVLRSGIISRNEGMKAEGIGSRTKWYFFPNAFVREFIGLLVSEWKHHLFWLVFFTAFFAAVNMIMPL